MSWCWFTCRRGKLWSEVEPGTTFSDWLSDQFGLGCRNWPIGWEMHTTYDLDQQHERVGATATRSGNGTLNTSRNPDALAHWSAAAQGCQPS